MKTINAFVIGVIVFAGLVVSAAPLFAAPHSPTHPAAGYVMQGAQPTPTPTPLQTDSDDGCSAGGC